MIGERLQRARKAAGLGLRALAEQSDLSHTTISKFENELQTPSSGQLLKLAKILGVRTEYFFRPQSLNIKGIEYRKKSSLPQKSLDKIQADIFDQAERWHELLNLYPQSPVQDFALPAALPEQITDAEQLEALAEQLRDAWKLGLSCIPDMIDTLESQGVMVISSLVEAAHKFDGLAATINDLPVVVVGANWTGDRQRFTLAHELGHLLLKNRLTNDLQAEEEKLCNRFAGAFLLPKPTLIEHLGQHRHQLEINELYFLKHEFGLSMQGVLFRALQCEIITQTTFQQLYKLFSLKGWRSKEPKQPYPAEQTILFKQLVYRALAEDYFTESKAAELLGLPVATFHQQRILESFEPLTH
ncbi:ImmA/IrrE family metallo-endopeptidase [Methylomonas paludis]|uniref:ImmA/IrrE family metallo-endopeptidase n=1 Tax=Methylomonas paludis TaxID=1173101 RepID=A0A975MPV6_9GAMM|nr:XRE family transcriptional regulator [Methylomonas paludis]QWF71610.1 ImmA/IrrE family metallo-endopeptidase [Methylomonas paludis]